MTTSTQRTLPAPKNVKDVLEDLLGRPVTVAEGMPVQTADLPSTAVATYVTERLQLGAVIALDMPLAAYAGAAVGLIPAGGAQACLEDKALSPAIAENLVEICNIMACVLNKEGCSRLKLERTYLPADPPPNDVLGCLLAIGRRIDLGVSITGYGGGRLSVCLAA
jgi:hypothetical protein